MQSDEKLQSLDYENFSEKDNFDNVNWEKTFNVPMLSWRSADKEISSSLVFERSVKL